MTVLITAAVVTLVTVWIGGWVWGRTRRREGPRDRV